MPLIPPGKRKGNRFYILRERINDREFEVSTKTTDKKSAEKFAITFRAGVFNGHINSRRARATFADALDMYIGAYEVSRNDERYLDRLRGEIGNKLLRGNNRLVLADIQAAARKLYPKGSAATRNRQAIAPAAAVIHFAADPGNDLCNYMPIKRFKERKPESRLPDDAAVSALLENATGPLALWSLFTVYQGWRVTEGLRLRWEREGTAPYIDLPRQQFVVYVSKAETWKRIPMHPVVFEALAAQTNKTGTVFPWSSRWRLYEELKPLCKSLNIDVTPHMLRHWFATNLAEADATDRDIVAAGSWTSEKSVGRYTETNMKHAQQVIERLPARGTLRGKVAK